MLRTLKDWVLRLVRVPIAPALPTGSADAWVFNAAPSYFRYLLTLWMLKQLVAAVGLVVGLLALSALDDVIVHPLGVMGLRTAEAFAWLTFLVQIPLSFAVLNLDFELRWYIVSDRSLRIREGILTLREKTVTFANVQNVEIRRNPLQRLLGLADVRVQTAGGGGGGSHGSTHVAESMHEAYFRGVDDPEKIRRAILDRVRRAKDAGLGDPDDHAGELPTPSPAPTPALLAATDLRREAELLRIAMERQVGDVVSRAGA
jgi:membrane protein YdbS with pleckstrin-like domain